MTSTQRDLYFAVLLSGIITISLGFGYLTGEKKGLEECRGQPATVPDTVYVSVDTLTIEELERFNIEIIPLRREGERN